MKIIWRREEATVREVYEEILDRRKIAYTTVMTMLGVLEGKGHLEKVAGEKAYVYRPSRPKEEVIASMVTDFVSRVFDGSARPLLEHLVRSEQVSGEELAEIARALEQTQSDSHSQHN